MDMGLWDMIIIVTVVACATGAYTEHLKTQRKIGGGGAALDEALDRIEDLEDRIRVLETVVTDNRYDLNREIDRLG